MQVALQIEKISCFGQDLKLFLPLSDHFNSSTTRHQTGAFVNDKSVILDTRTYSNDDDAKYWGIKPNKSGFGMIIRSTNRTDLNQLYHFNVQFNMSERVNITYSKAFGDLNGKPCDKFNEKNCTICSLPETELFLCKDTGFIKKNLCCNGEHDCDDGSDEDWHCHDADAAGDFVVVGATSAAFLVAGITYVAMLIKYKNLKDNKNILPWLLTPFTEPVMFLIRHYRYQTTDIKE